MASFANDTDGLGEDSAQHRQPLGDKKVSVGGSLIKFAKNGSTKVLRGPTSLTRKFTPTSGGTAESSDDGSMETLQRAMTEVDLSLAGTHALVSDPAVKVPKAAGAGIKGRISRALHRTLSRASTRRTADSVATVEGESPAESRSRQGSVGSRRRNSSRRELVESDDRIATNPAEEPEEHKFAASVVATSGDTSETPVEIDLEKPKMNRQPSATMVVTLNIGGQVFSTTYGTLTQFPDSLLFKMLVDGTNRVVDVEGHYFVDRDGKHFGTILNFLRSGTCTFPEPGSLEWEEMENEVTYYGLKEIQSAMQELELASFARTQRLEFLKQKLNGDEELIMTTQAKEIEKMRVELQRLLFENRKFSVLAKHKSTKDFAYNLLVVGVTGTGKSSSLNTLLDSPDNVVSGAQAQGTRGTVMRDGIIDDQHFISYIDTQGLGADTSVSDKTLLSHIMMSTECIVQMEVINNILVSFDLSARATPATMANQLTLIELFRELRESCFLCMTKWNTNSVLSEWNHSLREWVRRWRRAKSVEEIDEDPPSYETMYRSYASYLLNSLADSKDDAGAFAKMSIVLAFFEARVIWMFNLDEMEQCDKEEGELAPHVERMYLFYRQQALQTLSLGSTVIQVSDLVFLKSDEDTMLSVASRLIETRDLRLELIQRVASSEENFESFKTMFGAMTRSFASKVASRSYAPTEQYLASIAKLTGRYNELNDGEPDSESCHIS